MTKRCISSLFAFIGSLLFLQCETLLLVVEGIIVEVGPSVEECFIDHISTSRTTHMQVTVLSGGDLSIRLKAYGPFTKPPEATIQEQLFFNQLLKGDVDAVGNIEFNPLAFQFKTEHRTGYYRICLDNTHSSWAWKVVNLMLEHNLSEGIEVDEEEEVKGAHKSAMLLSLGAIERNLDKIRDMQSYHKTRMVRHLQTAESNKSRATYQTLLQVGLFVSLACFQVFYVRRWFGEPKNVTRWA